MFHIVYKITNNKNGKFYIGYHRTTDVNDNYMGSGLLIAKAIKKYGIESFTKQVLFTYDNAKEAFAKEAELLTEDLIKDEQCYNIKNGGHGGFSYLKEDGTIYSPEEFSKRANEALATKLKDPEYRDIFRAKIVEGLLKGNHINGFLGKEHSEATKQLMREKAKVHQSGSGNSQYGSYWITNGSENKKTRLDTPPEGWYKGRTIRK